MSYLLDTNTSIVYLNGRSASVRQKLEALSPRDVFVCSVVKAELFYGAMKSIDPKRTLAGQQLFLNQFVSLPFDDAAAEAYSQIRSKLNRAGTPIGPNDLMIAAIAVTNKVTLVTHNLREFGRVSELQCEDWK
jgi:tRNA(fMet)-specific endonuclease VapC